MCIIRGRPKIISVCKMVKNVVIDPDTQNNNKKILRLNVN